MPPGLSEQLFAAAHENLPNLVPTTYEASMAYIDQERLKPSDQQDLTREMCMVIVMKIPEDREIMFRADATKLLIELRQGETGLGQSIRH
jgi:hypothetical protein